MIDLLSRPSHLTIFALSRTQVVSCSIRIRTERATSLAVLLSSMICVRCLRRATSQSFGKSNGLSKTSGQSLQYFSSSIRLSKQKPISPNAAAQSTPQCETPAATSTAAAQPFSSKDTLSPEVAGTPTAPASEQQLPPVKSSVPGGTPLHGLNYFKNKEDPLAMEDHEYPDWLWGLLSEKKSTEAGEEAKDPRLFAKSARSRRAANKRARKATMEEGASPEQMVPIYEQSVDLPEGAAARQELSKAMREKRRKDIKEANFLKSMG